MTLIEFKKYCVDFLINAASGSIKSASHREDNKHLFWKVMALRWFIDYFDLVGKTCTKFKIIKYR